jgi:cyclopropane-fatty-acyl-phospholipid synthase
MSHDTELSEAEAVPEAGAGLLARLASRLVPPLKAGCLTVRLPSGARIERQGKDAGPEVTIDVHRWRTFPRLAFGGDVAFAASYLDSDWSTPDLVRLFDLFMQNESVMGQALYPALPARLLSRLRHGKRRNTRRGSRRNIAAHYDLGNDFYRPWLDQGMTYSSALYEGSETLEEAQNNKIDRAAALLDLKGGEKILEIGCGWGALAERLIRHHGANVTGITLSEEQLAYASERLRAESAAGKADMRLVDYRDVGGQYDRIVSIEMFEAVGETYWTTYFDAVRDRLKAGGVAVLQVITIAEQRFAAYRQSPDFIQRYIFPGGMLPTKTMFGELAEKSGLQLVSDFSFADGYARTLAEWRRRFRLAWAQIEPLGFDERFRRMWDYYLSYCEVGFSTGSTDVTLFKLQRA